MREKSLERTLSLLRRGIKCGDFILFSSEPEQGRFAQEINLKLFLKKGNQKQHLLYAKIFKGRAYYRDWIEIFGLSKDILGEPYFGSDIETEVLDLFAPLTGRLFVEYYNDMETVRELSLGVPPSLSRLGFELGRRGFTWFKDWYFPEGLMEGGHKLQAEKPRNASHLSKHIENLKGELETFLSKNPENALKEIVSERFKILQSLWRQVYSWT